MPINQPVEVKSTWILLYEIMDLRLSPKKLYLRCAGSSKVAPTPNRIHRLSRNHKFKNKFLQG